MFTAAIFAGATLLFTCQPMVARMIVPLLGGAPSVWIVCSLCFQALLLAGYGYTHFVATRLPVRLQIVLQLALVAAVLLVMPIVVDEATVSSMTSRHHTLGLIALLLQTAALPFFVLSTSSPLMQRWFAELGEHDPYHLYAASNAGSMVALLGYPLVVEPLLAVRGQSRALHLGFAVYTLLVVVCAALAVRRAAPGRVDTTPAPPQVHVDEHDLPPRSGLPGARPATAPARWRERLLWIGLSFAPSSLLLGVTEYVTTDIASVPLLWVLPLALYLLSFIVAFAKQQPVRPSLVSRVLALVTAGVAALTLGRVAGPPWLVVGAHVLLLFVASVVCHRGLAERRPHVSRLTEFYLLLSIGGVLGGAFNGLVAPFLFDDLYEYPIAIALVCLGRAAVKEPSVPPIPGQRSKLDRTLRDVAFGGALGLVTYGLVRYGASKQIDHGTSFGWMFGVPIVFALAWARRPVRFAIAVGGLLLAGMSHGGAFGKTLWADRGFFGVLKVTQDREERFRLLVSGRAMHGRQALDPERADVPLAFYYPTGPAGDVLGPLPLPNDGKPDLKPADAAPRRVGVIGLGVGSLAAYARPGDDWTFFEINPAVVDVARDYFTYVKHAEERAKVSIEIGDARQRLREGGEGRFDVLVLDAFSSDAVPVHLVTREAIAVYRRALRDGGLLLAHVTNDHVRLPPIFGALAREGGLRALIRTDDHPTPADVKLGKSPSQWVLLARSPAELERFDARTEWLPLGADASQSVWTDDYANVLGALRF